MTKVRRSRKFRCPSRYKLIAYGLTAVRSSAGFQVGGNMPGRGAGERLVIDPNNNSILYLGARSGHGLYKSTDFGLTWNRVTSLSATGAFVTSPSDTSGEL